MRRSTASWLVIVAFLGASAGHTAANKPSLIRDRNELVLLTDLPPILEEEEVAEQLGKGLTTTFAFQVDLPVAGGQAAGVARAEIRFELWDEVFHVATIGVDARVSRRVISSHEELLDWWEDLALPVLDGSSEAAASASQARVTLEVVPFSRAEQDEAQRWFAEGVGRREGAGESVSDSPDDREGSLEQVFSVLIATSIQRRALISYRWTLDLPRRAE